MHQAMAIESPIETELKGEMFVEREWIDHSHFSKKYNFHLRRHLQRSYRKGIAVPIANSLAYTPPLPPDDLVHQ